MIPQDIETRTSMITYMLQGIGTSSHEISDWESDFYHSVKEQFEVRGNLTDRQCEILQKIFDKLS